jgi:hypothetical protein
MLYKINSSFINQFDNCWIPDYNDYNSLSGVLSKNPKLTNYSFIGPLSRFKKSKNISPYKYKYLAILSGPEPQRTIFEKIILKAFSKVNEPCAIIGGNPLGKQYTIDNVKYYCHLKTEDFLNTVSASDLLICRSGYSNIMDLSVLNKKALLVPTPGQTEQEYLAKYHANKSSVKWINQQEFNINNDSDFGHTITSKINYLLDEELI